MRNSIYPPLLARAPGYQNYSAGAGPLSSVVAAEALLFQKIKGPLKCPNKSKQIHWWQKAEALLVVPRAPLYKL